MSPESWSRRQFLRISALTAASAALSACARPTEELPATTESEEPTEPEATEETVPSPEPEENTLKVMHWNGKMTREAAFWDENLQEFENRHPALTVDNNVVPFGEYTLNLEAMIAAGTPPDVFWGLTKILELGRGKAVIDWYNYVDEDFLDGFYWGPVEHFIWDGELYAIPSTAQTFGFFVHDTLMQELGLEPPETWDDLIAMAPDIRDAGLAPVVFGNQDKGTAWDFWLPLVAQYGGNASEYDTQEKSWVDEPVIQAFELLQRLVAAGVFIDGINGISRDQAYQLAFQGRSPMFYQGSWFPGVANSQAPEEYLGTYYVWPNPALKPGDPHLTADSSGRAWAVSKDRPNTDLGVEFVKYQCELDVYKKYIAGVAEVPAMPEAIDAVEDEKVQVMTTFLEDGVRHILFDKGSSQAVGDVCAEIMAGVEMTPEEAAQKMQDIVEAARAG